MSAGIFDDLVAAARRIDLGGSRQGEFPAIIAGFGVPTAAEATGSIYYRQDAPDASNMLYVRAVNAWWPIPAAAGGATQIQANAAWNIGVLAGNTRITTAIAVPGLSVGDFVLASLSGGSFEGNFGGCELTAWVGHVSGEGAGTYKAIVSVFNTLGGGTLIGNVTARVLVFKHT